MCHSPEPVHESRKDPASEVPFPVGQTGVVQDNPPLFFDQAEVLISDLFPDRLCNGIHSLLNIITGPEDDPQGVLIRCCEGAEGPGKLTRALGIDLSFNGLDILTTERIDLCKGPSCAYDMAPRVGIGYASPEDQLRPWRFIRKGE